MLLITGWVFLGAEQKELSSRLQIDPVAEDTLQVTQG